jgi:hypothetical protein
METIILNIDSKFRDKEIYPSPTDFKYKLDFPIKNVIEISLTSIRIPNTSYKISSAKGNNVIRINNSILQIDDGNYTLVELIGLINYHSSLTQPYVITMAVEENANKTIISSELTFSVFFPKLTDYPSLGEILGFNNTEYTDLNFYRSERVVNFIDNFYYLLKLNDYGKVYNINIKYFAKILARVTKDFVDYESNFEFVTKTMIFEQPIDIEVFKIELYDYLNNLIDLNGLEIDLTLEIKTITNSLLKKYKELNFYDEELMNLVLNDQMLKFYVEANKQIELFNTYEKVLKSETTKSKDLVIKSKSNDFDETIFNPRVNLEPLEKYLDFSSATSKSKDFAEPDLTNPVDKKIEEISKNYNNTQLKQIEYEDNKKREEKKKKRKIKDKFKY